MRHFQSIFTAVLALTWVPTTLAKDECKADGSEFAFVSTWLIHHLT